MTSTAGDAELENCSLDIREAVRFPLRHDVRPWVLAAAGAGIFIELVNALPIPLIGLLALIFRLLIWITVYRVASEILLASAEGDTGALREPLNNSARSAFQSEKPQIVGGEPSDSSHSYGQGSQRARCGFSGETRTGRVFAGPPLRLDSLIWNNQTTLAQAETEHPAKAPSRPRRVVQRFPNFRTMESADGLAIRHIGLWLIATFLLVLLSIYFGTAGVVIGSFAIAAVLPAATIILTVSKSLFDALVPTQWLRLASRIGRGDYLRLYAALLGAALIYLAIAGLLGWLGAGQGLRNLLQLAYWAFAVFGWFHLAGRAVFIHRDELNLIEPDTEPEKKPERFTRDAETLWRQIRERGGTREMHAELARQLERSGERERRLAHGHMHLEALLFSFELPDEALDRTQRMLAVDADFCLERPQSMRALIRAARDQGVDRLTGRLCSNYLKRFPNSAKADEIRLIGCEALAENASSQREHAERWFRDLMTSKLDDNQRDRLKTIAPGYLGTSSRPD